MISPILCFLFFSLVELLFVRERSSGRETIHRDNFVVLRRGPNFDLKFSFFLFFFFWVLYPKIYVHIYNRCIRSAIFVCPISGDPGDIVLIPKCKNCERHSSLIVSFDFRSKLFSQFYLFIFF